VAEVGLPEALAALVAAVTGRKEMPQEIQAPPIEGVVEALVTTKIAVEKLAVQAVPA
jgi:hypothetical protein